MPHTRAIDALPRRVNSRGEETVCPTRHLVRTGECDSGMLLQPLDHRLERDEIRGSQNFVWEMVRDLTDITDQQ